jgi:hypothetical protein
VFLGAGARWAVGAALAVLVGNWIAAVARLQSNVLFWDQWGFFVPVTQGSGWWGLFDRQHGPHRQGLAFVLTSWLMDFFRWDERVDSLWIVTLLLAAAVLALLLRRRISGPLRAGDAWIALAVLSLGQCESVITTPNASHSVFPLLLALVLGHAWLSGRPAVRYLGAGLCGAALAFTGFGMFAGAAAAVLLACALVSELRTPGGPGARLAAAGLAVSLAGWALFLRGYVFDPASPGFRFPWSPATDYARFWVLMLTAPAGWQEATPLHYAVGTGCALALAAVLWASLRTAFSGGPGARTAAVVALLGMSSVGFCAYAAVGRVHLGVGAGLTSRYATLVTQAWLAWYLWSGAAAARARTCSQAALWILVLVPYLDLAHRPAAEWAGSAGMSDGTYAKTRGFAGQKLDFLTVFALHQDADFVEREADAAVLPGGFGGYLAAGLAYQRQERLSFFAHPEAPFGYAPWLAESRLVWVGAYGPEGRMRWIGRTSELDVGTRAAGFLNFEVVGRNPALRPDARLRVSVDGAFADLLPGSGGVSLPVPPGTHAVFFESPSGAPRPGNGDTRGLSFTISEPTLTRAPAFLAYVEDPRVRTLAPCRSLEIVSGFQGWEDGGRSGWSRSRLELSAGARVPAYLNVAVMERLPGLRPGKVVVTVAGRAHSLDLGPGGISFSVALAARPEAYPVSIENSSGEAAPSDLGPSGDHRRLALRFSRLSVDAEAAFGVLDAP